MIQKLFNNVFGSYNERQIKKLNPSIERIKSREPHFDKMSDEELKTQFQKWKSELSKEPQKVDEKLEDVFAAIKSVAKRLLGKKFPVRGKDQEWNMVHYDVQLIGGIILHQGKITEMKTGEGKTLVCTLPVILNALTGKGVHIVTVNDYLAQRDAEWMTPLYEFCGLTTGVIINSKDNNERKEAYKADITYGTNNEFGFDYLRDNMAQDPKELVQRPLHYAIVDEVDSILIDESRTPLIISAPAEESTKKYEQYAQIIPQLEENEDYNIDLKQKVSTLTEKGVAKLENILKIENVFTEKGFDEVHHIENALRARVIFEKDRDYVVQNDQVIIVDEFTGRLMPGRRFSDGLHQALEAKERVQIQRESKTLATITFQNYFRLYEKLAGMTGTAETEAEEFIKIYSLDTLVIPTNKPIARDDREDQIFKNEPGKFKALARKVKELHKKGQPVLIGTVNIDKSELISRNLKIENIPHEVLNAKQHEREAEIVAKAGQKGAVTIATNMAGRGTDIKLGEGVKELGGLVILGTERHESRRIDNQLRGRAGRQGDPGMTQFYISMKDDLMRRFGGEKMSIIMERLQMPDDEPIQNGMISRSVENAQKKIEGFHFDARKHLVQYDDVMNIHREKMYGKRREILFDEDIEHIVKDMIQKTVEDLITAHAPTTEIDDDWDLQEILESIQAIHLSKTNPLDLESLKEFTYRTELIENITEYLLKNWALKRDNTDTKMTNKITKYVVLRTLDDIWLNHINEMTHLRDRVALSGYAQKDPVMEYKRQAFEMFREMMYNIHKNVVLNLFRVEFEKKFEMEKSDTSKLQTNARQILATLQAQAQKQKEQVEQSHKTQGEQKNTQQQLPRRLRRKMNRKK